MLFENVFDILVYLVL